MATATFFRPGSTGAMLALAGVVLTGAFVAWQLSSQGHAAFNTRSDGLMWGLPIVTYDFLLMCSAGCALLASLWTAFGFAPFAPLARRALWLALALLLGGVLALFLELGHPLRALYATPLNLQYKAPLFWKVIAAFVYVVSLAVLALGWLARRQAGPRPGRAASLALFMSALILVLAGALMYATLGMRPLWHSGEVPAMILTEALLGGLAFTLLATNLAREPVLPALSRTAAGLIAMTLLFLLGRMVVGLYSNVDGMQVWDRIAESALFWSGIACLAVALWLTASTSMHDGPLQAIAMALVIAGLFIAKYDFVIGGQLVPLFKGAWVRGLIEYTPSAAEWAVLAMSALLAFAIYAFGASRLRLGAGG